MSGYALGECAVGGGGEVNLAALGVLLAQEGEERLVVGEVLDVKCDGGGNAAGPSGGDAR